jgi:surface antigen
MSSKQRVFGVSFLLFFLFHAPQAVHAGLTMCGLFWWDSNNVFFFQEQSSETYYLISDSVLSQFINRPGGDACGTWGSFYFEDVQVEPVSPPGTLSFFNGAQIAEWRITYVGRFVCIAHREGMCPAIPTNTPIPSPTTTPIPPTPIPPTRTSIPPTLTPVPATNTRIIPTSTHIPTIITIAPIKPTPTKLMAGGPLPKNGYEPGLTLLERILQSIAPPVDAFSPADCQARFTENNCTWFVAGKRPDVCQWITPGQGNAYQWVGQAQANGGNFGVIVRAKPQMGDIAVWGQGCGGTPAGTSCSEPQWACGHVALVTWVSSDEKRIKIQEMNWSEDRSNMEIPALDCMSFISQPSKGSIPPSSKPTETPAITPPVPVPVPAPTQSGTTPLNIIEWLKSLFGG